MLLGVFVEGAGPFEGLTFSLQVDGSVTIGRLDARMTEPMADRNQIDPRAQKENGGAMAKRVGVYALGGETGYLHMGFLCVAPEDVANTKAAERFATMISEDWLGLTGWFWQHSEERPQ